MPHARFEPPFFKVENIAIQCRVIENSIIPLYFSDNRFNFDRVRSPFGKFA